MIHIIGDSHSLTFEGAKGVKCHWMDAWTAHNLWKKVERLKLEIVNPADTYWFLFGEIDCRMHIYRKHMSLGKSLGRLIDDTVDNYVKAVATFSEFNIGIMAVPPQGYQDNFYDFDFYASQKTRQQITDGFNFALENECHDANIRFIDIWGLGYEKLPDDVFSWPENDFKEDKCHIKNAIAIRLLEDFLWQK
jgi:hypothetical protein